MFAHRWVLLLVVLAMAGCAANGAGTSNFSLHAERVGWYAGDEAHFTLEISSTLLKRNPSFTLDRHFAIEEIQFEEGGVSFGGSFETRDPDLINLRLVRDNVTYDEVVLDEANPRVEIYLTLPSSLRDSQYALELKLFKVGWVTSDPFRVDRR